MRLRTGDRTASLPPGHLGRGVAARRLADQLRVVTRPEFLGDAADLHHVWQDCKDDMILFFTSAAVMCIFLKRIRCFIKKKKNN